MRKLVWFAVPFAVAVLIYVFFLSLIAGLLLASAALAGFLIARLCNARRCIAVVLLGLFFGFAWCSAYEQFVLRPIWQVSGQTVAVTAQVSGYPTETSYGSRVAVTITLDGRSAKAMLYLNEQNESLAPGDTLQLDAELKQSTIGRDDEEFLYFQSIGVQLLAYQKSEPVIEKCDKTPILLLPVVLAERLRQTVQQVIPADTAGFLQALLTGDKSNLSYATKNEFAVAGVSHMVAVSGMHVAMLLAMLSFLTAGHRKLTAAIGIPLVMLYAIMTGGSPSAWRAALMLTVFLLAPLLNRRNDPPTSLCAAMLLLLVLNPWAISNVSFQLSFAAMAGITLFAGRIFRAMTAPKWVAKLFKIKAARSLTMAVVTSVSVTLGAIALSTPIAAATFGMVAVYGVISNLLILSIVNVVFCAGLIICLLALFYLPLAQVLGWVLAWPIRWILLVAGWISRLPYAALDTSSPYTVFWLVFVYALLAAWLFARKKPRAWLPVACIAAGLVLTITLSSLDARVREFKISVLDVGQGQCICVQMPQAAAIIDCGGSTESEAGELAARMLLPAGAQVQCLILTHYDKDHTNGIEQLFHRVSVQTLYLPDVEDESGNRARIERLAQQNGVKICYVTQDFTLSLDGATLQIFAPMIHTTGNQASLSVLFTTKEYDMLVTGEMSETGEQLLLATHTLPDTELYIAGHHGSKYSSGEKLLSAICPETAVISVGYNSYGHPAHQTLDRLNAAGAQIYRTDECGTVTIGR